MLRRFTDYINKEQLFRKKDRVLLAVSGGMDSVCMEELFHKAGFNYGIAHVNFRLRGEDSRKDEQYVRDLALKRGVPFYMAEFDTRNYAKSRHISIQMAARELRYDWFHQVADEEGYLKIATAHNLDDQVETFLLNLARGTGISGLKGIPVAQGRVVRPLLFASREEIYGFIKAEKISYREDISNRSVKYARNRVRHKVIPEMEKINPSFKKEVLKTMGFMRKADTILQKAVGDVKVSVMSQKGDEIRLSIKALQGLDPLVTWLFELLSPYGFNLSVIEDLKKALKGQPGKVFESDSHRLVKDREYLIITPLDKENDEETALINGNKGKLSKPVRLEWDILSRRGFSIPEDPSVAFIDGDLVQDPLLVRKWKTGDYFYPLGLGRRKKLSDLFTDLKLSMVEKEKIWLVCSGREIVWVAGHRLDDRFKVTGSTRKVLRLRLK